MKAFNLLPNSRQTTPTPTNQPLGLHEFFNFIFLLPPPTPSSPPYHRLLRWPLLVVVIKSFVSINHIVSMTTVSRDERLLIRWVSFSRWHHITIETHLSLPYDLPIQIRSFCSGIRSNIFMVTSKSFNCLYCKKLMFLLHLKDDPEAFWLVDHINKSTN